MIHNPNHISKTDSNKSKEGEIGLSETNNKSLNIEESINKSVNKNVNSVNYDYNDNIKHHDKFDFDND